MKDLCIMLKPASSLCNLRCKYCFYADVSELREVHSYGMMQLMTAKKILDHVFAESEPGDHITLAFQGGEPTLAGLSFFQDFVKEVAQRKGQVRVSYALQTNAMLLNEDWCIFLKENDFLVGVSLDGMAENHDACRVDVNGKGTYKRVMTSRVLLEQYGVSYNILMTLTNSMARHPQKVWRFIRENKFQYVQLTPCLGSLKNNDEKNVYALTPKRFAQFYQQIFSLWYEAWNKGEYISVKLIDDLVNLLAYGAVSACGLRGKCSPQFVVEADGSVYPCDFYMLDCYKAGTLCEQTLREIFDSPQMKNFWREKRHLNLCEKCPYQNFCGGGCKRMKKEVYHGESDTVCGYREFLDYALEDLCKVARQVRDRGSSVL